MELLPSPTTRDVSGVAASVPKVRHMQSFAVVACNAGLVECRVYVVSRHVLGTSTASTLICVGPKSSLMQTALSKMVRLPRALCIMPPGVH